MPDQKESLFTEFPPVSKEEWEKVIRKDLKGADYREKLRWDTGEGIEVLPFYMREDLKGGRAKEPLRDAQNRNQWTICSPVYASDINEANKKSKEAIENGSQGLQFKIHVRHTSGALGGDLEGIPVQNQDDFGRLLSGIDTHAVNLVFDSGMASPVLLSMLQNWSQKNKNRNKISARFSYDPFSYVAQKGQLPKRRPVLYNEIAGLVQSTDSYDHLSVLCADGRLWHDAGGTIIHELGLSLAAASEYLAILTERDLPADKVARKICFFISVGSKYFPEIAKLRALRLLWKQMLKAYGVENPDPVYIHGETSAWNKTVYDPYVNMLRTSTEGMAAAIAGVDSLAIHPFDATYDKPDDFSSRIARNSQIIMQEEAHLDKVNDPAAGSYYVEEMTDKIARKAWSLFQEIENEGGLLESLRNGTVQTSIEEARKGRDRKIASRQRIFVGTNQYPNAEERKKQEISHTYNVVSLNETDYEFELTEDGNRLIADLRRALDEGAAMGDLAPKLLQEDYTKHEYRIVTPYRGAFAFEELRKATERQDNTPHVLTIPLGDRKMRKVRSTFSANFFGCAGYHIEDPIGFESVSEAVEAIRDQQPDIVVLCSSDKEYRDLVPRLCEELKKLGQKPITVLAGYPKEHVDEYRDKGIDEFIHAHSNVLESLHKFQQKLGID